MAGVIKTDVKILNYWCHKVPHCNALSNGMMKLPLTEKEENKEIQLFMV